MQRKILLLVFNFMMLFCYPVQSEISQEEDASHEYPEIWNETACGTRAAGNIPTTESESTNGKWPWVASIYLIDPSDKRQPQHQGTASIITSRHLITIVQVVTSGNSSAYLPTDYVAIIGGEYKEQGLFYDIQDIFRKYIPSDEYPNLSGIAIVRLVNTLTLTDHIRPLCLPKMGDIDYSQTNQSLTTVGWGYLSNDSSETRVLYEVEIPMQPEEFCQQYIRGPYPKDLLYCGAQTNETTCKFENGGPLMTSKDGIFSLVGVTDTNIGKRILCGRPEIPIYFIKVVTLMDWITKVILNS